ncbi:MAG: riboflavin biosynthesis protein RibF, partial [Armatimonadota bacterium]|nr:riboflavin biosynthesis protein RibF [Armatimonadota bacterium]
MEVYHGLDAVPRSARPTYLALGMFDGVHLGHRAVLARTRELAASAGGRHLALTFEPHPQRVIAPTPEPVLLTTIEERLELFAAEGMDGAVVVRFDEALRQTPAERWLEMLAGIAAGGGVVVSSSYTFGRDRQGTVELLWARGERLGFVVAVVPAVRIGGVLVSSTLIRRLVRAGRAEEARAFLGRPYAVRGRVVRGGGRGRALGFPTANLAVHPDKVLPGRGIYAARTRVGKQVVPAAVSVGTRPTFGEGDLVVEAFLLDFDGDLYGREVELLFERRLRDEAAFGGIPDLV